MLLILLLYTIYLSGPITGIRGPFGTQRVMRVYVLGALGPFSIAGPA